MTLQYEIKEDYTGDFTLIGRKNYDIEYKVNIPKRKAKNERFIQKSKEKIEKEYKRLKQLNDILNSVEAHSEDIKQPEHYLENYNHPIRFNIREGVSFLLLVKKEYNNELAISVYYEEYNNRTTLWDRNEIEKIKVNGKIKPHKLKTKIESILNREWNIILNINSIEKNIQHTFNDLGYTIEFLKEESWIQYVVKRSYGLQVLTRFRIVEKNKQLALSIYSDGFDNKINMGLFEERKTRPGVMDAKKWVSSTLFNKDLDNLNKQLQNMIIAKHQKQHDKEQSINFVKKVLNNA